MCVARPLAVRESGDGGLPTEREREMRNWITAGFVSVMLGMAPAWSAENVCSAVVDRTLASLGVDRGDIARIDYGSETSSGEGAELVAIRAWVRLKSCDGRLVVDMTPNCRLVQTYTRRQCRVPGVAHY